MKIPAINHLHTFKSNEQAQQTQQTQQVAQPSKRPAKIHPTSATGWVAVGAFGTAMVSGILRTPLVHKLSAFIGAAAAISHIYLVTNHHHNHKKNIVA